MPRRVIGVDSTLATAAGISDVARDLKEFEGRLLFINFSDMLICLGKVRLRLIDRDANW